MKNIIYLIILLVLFTGCSTSYEKISSGAIGCAPSQITVYDVDSSYEGTSWTAVCNNRIYYCFQADESMGGKFKCSPGRTTSRQNSTIDERPAAGDDAPQERPRRYYERDDRRDRYDEGFLAFIGLFFLGLLGVFD